MEQRISLVTLGVADVPRARRFYERLGWSGQETQGTVFLQAGGAVLVLWSRALLAADAGVPDDGPGGFGGVALAHNVRTPSEVDEVLTRAAAAGGVVTVPARTTSYGGYAGWFTDPDGHVWEIAHNPGFPLAPDGTVTVPDLGGSAAGGAGEAAPGGSGTAAPGAPDHSGPASTGGGPHAGTAG